MENEMEIIDCIGLDVSSPRSSWKENSGVARIKAPIGAIQVSWVSRH
jgi:hypothetical protein